MLGPRLFVAQRVSAAVMAPLVLGHLLVMIYAVQGGLDSAEILARTRGSLFWGTYYELFVTAVAIHAAIGVRVIAYEWFKVKNRWLEVVTVMIGCVLFLSGTYAVYAVVA